MSSSTHRFTSWQSLWALLAAATVLMTVAVASAQAAEPEFMPDMSAFDTNGLGGGRLGALGQSQDVTITAKYSAAEGEQSAMLFITALIPEPYHIYAIDQGADESGAGPKPTTIKVDPAGRFELIEPLQALDPPSVRHDTIAWEGLAIREHHHRVTWFAPIRWAQGIDPAAEMISGAVTYQACTESRCKPIATAPFQATLDDSHVGTQVAPGGNTSADSIASLIVKANACLASAANPKEAAPAESLFQTLMLGLLGGLILNLMPCVLPVIGLKVMSFAKQGGESRSRVLSLNLAYAAGLMAVFLTLATLALVVQQGGGLKWGQLNTFTWFKVGMGAFCFAMALSFLGTWELPIPGFASSSKATELAAQEGLTGAFFMGAFTTILATPCSGPFLGPVLGYTISQPPLIVYAIFASIGLGMALPYLLIGMFPSLVSWIPKPGAWMDTFKNLMGFVLLGVVVFLFSSLDPKYFLYAFTLLIGIWFACWWIGRTPVTAPLNAKATAWVGGVGTATLVGLFAFTIFTPKEKLLPWQPFSPQAVAQARAEGKTVMVDFTANWCLTCKWNTKMAIDRQAVLKKVNDNDVVALLADWTNPDPTIERALNELNSVSIPLLAIYPAGQDQPIVLPDTLTEQNVLDALDRAGPSRPPQMAGRRSHNTYKLSQQKTIEPNYTVMVPYQASAPVNEKASDTTKKTKQQSATEPTETAPEPPAAPEPY